MVSGARGSLKSEGLEAPFVGRDRELRQIKDMFHASADEKPAAPGVGDRDRRHRQVAPGLGVLQVLRRPRPGDLLAPRPLPLLRRGRHLLGAGRHGAHALPDHRGRARRLRRREAAGGARRAHPGRRRARVRRAPGGPAAGLEEGTGSTARISSRPGASSSSGWPTSTRRCSRSRTCSGRTRRCSTSSSTCSSGRETRPLRDHGRPARSWSSGGRPGAQASATSRRSISSRFPSRPWRRSWRAWCRDSRTSLAEQILARSEGVPLYAVETVRMLLDRGLLVQEGASTGRPGRSRRWRCRRRCTR